MHNGRAVRKTTTEDKKSLATVLLLRTFELVIGAALMLKGRAKTAAFLRRVALCRDRSKLVRSVQKRALKSVGSIG